MTSRPLVTVVMNCLNGETFLQEAIDSVYAQTLADWEIVFIDNASTDGTAAIARGYDSRLRYFRNEATVPLGASRNAALDHARGAFVAFLDCDDVWLPEKLEKQVALFNDSSVGLVFSNVNCFDGSGYERPLYAAPPPQGNVFARLVRFDNFLCMSTVVVRAEIVAADGERFDPALSGLEDTDLFVRICRQWNVAGLSAVLARYRVHDKSVSATSPGLFFDEQELMIAKYCRAFPDFERQHAAEVRRRVRRDQAVHAWKTGRGWEARAMVWPLVLQEPRYALEGLAMLVPYSLVHPIRVALSRRVVIGNRGSAVSGDPNEN